MALLEQLGAHGPVPSLGCVPVMEPRDLFQKKAKHPTVRAGSHSAMAARASGGSLGLRTPGMAWASMSEEGAGQDRGELPLSGIQAPESHRQNLSLES